MSKEKGVWKVLQHFFVIKKLKVLILTKPSEIVRGSSIERLDQYVNT